MSVQPTVNLLVVARPAGPMYYAKWRHEGHQIKRLIGPAWIERGISASAGRRRTRHEGWIKRQGRPDDGHLSEDMALARVPNIVADWEASQGPEAPETATFDDLVDAWLDWEERVKAIKATTLRDYRGMLRSVDDVPKRGDREPLARVMRTFSGRSAASITSMDVSRWLSGLDRDRKLSARTRNKYRAVMHCIFKYACRDDTFALAINPVIGTDRRREPDPPELVTYSVAEVLAITRALRDGRHRDPRRATSDPHECAARRAEDEQDAVLVLVAAFAGLRMGELLALRWRHVGWEAQRVHVQRAYALGAESSPKSRRHRTVPLADQAAQALAQLSQRARSTSPSDLVFCSRVGGYLDDSALRRRYKAARDVVRADLPDMPELRFHDLRHTFGTLAASRFDLTNVQAMMGHSDVTTTARYLHARPAFEDAAKLTAIFASGASHEHTVRRATAPEPG